ncbi:hypothetical protein [Klebsiella variicola]|uniref:hypothetical protein n=1 Tax=Klebsiella variicola TaxID=244366 RepID=UPI001433098B|nr:hypothetical protein [Klebsiella variicola]MCH6140124.1 hypothetical protein [Klebsiella variicola]MCH6175158.1 hypothetical protein [Klebsiella variicola]
MTNSLTGVKVDHHPIPSEDPKCEQEMSEDIFIDYHVNGERFSPVIPIGNIFNVKTPIGSD